MENASNGGGKSTGEDLQRAGTEEAEEIAGNAKIKNKTQTTEATEESEDTENPGEKGEKKQMKIFAKRNDSGE